MPKSRVSAIAAAAALALASVAHAQTVDLSQGGLLGGLPSPSTGEALARGAGGLLTKDGVAAYVEALEFVLAQIGQPTTFPPDTREQIEQQLAAAFPSLPVEVQADLANARAIWDQYRGQWGMLGLDAKREFAYYVLALAYGEQAAAQAVGIGAQGGGSYGSSGGGYNPSVDDMLGVVPGSDCWGSAGCTGYDSSTDTYTFESFE